LYYGRTVFNVTTARLLSLIRMHSVISRFDGIKKYILAHKITTGVFIAIIVVGGYFGWGKLHPASTETRYVMGTVATGTIVASVSASGQVSASDSIDVKPQVSGTITNVYVQAGDQVGAGQALAFIDDTSAQQTLQQAKSQYAADQLQYQKDTAQAPINYQSDLTTLANAKEALATDYNNTYNDLTSTYLDLPTVISGAENTIYGYDFDSRRLQDNADALMGLFTTQNTSAVDAFRKKALADYDTARAAYDKAIVAYQQTSHSSDDATVESLLSQTEDTTTDIAQALQSELNFLNAVSELAQTYNLTLPAKFSTVQSNARSYLATTNGDLSTLLTDKKNLDNGKQTISSAQDAVTLDQVGNAAGNNPISLQISKNNLDKEAQTIANQEADLAKYTVRSPFSGMVSIVNVKPGDPASGAIATVITHSKVATLSLNEVDAAKIKLGNNVTLTFDAIDGLSLTGRVVEMDPIGTVSQGVVSYDIKVSFDTQDARVKPGMTVNASIQTGVATDALTVPSSAVKTQGNQSYVLAFVPPIPDAQAQAAGSLGVTSDVAPQQIPVTTGLSDDTNVQILSGLESGQQVVISTKTGTASVSSATSGSSNRNSGFVGSGAVKAGGAVRIGG
jgi:HlyD family secretion protein